MRKLDVPPSCWEALGTPPPDTLTETRLELHWAGQLVAAAPLAFCEAMPDSSHMNLGWIAEEQTFVSRSLGSAGAVHLGLRVLDLSLVLLDAEAQALDALSLAGRTLAEGYDWVSDALERFDVGTADAATLPRPGDDFPTHAIGSGARFTGGDPAARAELGRWFGNAMFVLSEVSGVEPGASAVRTWPHHFDMATLISVKGAGTDGSESRRSIGVGLSPGDSDYDEPYFYATPWPYPENATLSPLAGRGLWHLTGWTGAVLKGTRLVEGADETVQLERVRKFLASAIPAGRRLAGA